MKTLALLALASAGLPACLQFVPVNGKNGGEGARPTYAGAECERNGARRADEATREDEILDRVCGGTRGRIARRDPVHAAMSIEKRHKEFDDRHPDLVVAAMNVSDCGDQCEPLATGIATYYAGLFDDASLAAALEPLELPADAKQTFVKLAAVSKEQLAAKAAKLDDRRKHMYIEVVSEVVKKRQAYFAAHAEEYRKLGALEARAAESRKSRKAPADLVDQLEQLRAGYFAACADDDCRFDPFPIELTKELVLLAMVGGQPMLARAENFLLAEPAAGRHLFSVETGTAVYEAMTEERHDWELYESAKREGVDARALEARFGKTAPFEVDPSTDYIGSDRLPDLTKMFGEDGSKDPDQRLDMASGVVRAVIDTNKKDGNGQPLVQVAFKDNVSSEDVESCYETGKVTGVHFDSDNHATLDYETVCNTVGTKTNVEKVPPVFVPKAEASGIKPGENLLALVAEGTHEGLVVRSTAAQKAAADGEKQGKTPVLQVRGQRFAAKTK